MAERLLSDEQLKRAADAFFGLEPETGDRIITVDGKEMRATDLGRKKVLPAAGRSKSIVQKPRH